MNSPHNTYLLVGSVASSIAALLHIGCIVFGAPWYRFFGAGEKMARLAEAGSVRPTLITTCIVTGLFIWALYALSGAGVIAQLPLLRIVLCVITAIYLLRALAGIPLAYIDHERSTGFWVWSSLICLSLGTLHFIGLKQVWSQL
jgi:hypothetical protein